jgi:hypothetical protein
VEVIALVVSSISLITSLLVFHKLSTKGIEPQYILVNCCSTKVEETVQEEPVVSPQEISPTSAVTDDRYHAWKNIKEEPVKAPLTFHQPSIPARGPLERPPGFV